MITTKQNKLQKTSIIVHLFSLAGLVLAINLRHQLGSWIEIILPISLGLWMFTFYFSFNKTGLFNFTHTKLTSLDERELAVTSKAIRFAYSVFSILILILLFFYALTSATVHTIVAGVMVYVAHVLPAVYLGWKGEER
ncbi:MAG: hypothetical protein U9N86_11115 [Bacteroidota bacterium]|nr:hypothetical protein [Bacteroidota bacterium]